MMAAIRRLLGIKVQDLSGLRTAMVQERQLLRLARAERTDKLFATVVREVRK